MNKTTSTAILSFILLLSIQLVQAQIVNIPDPNFKTALLEHDPVIDINDDGEIQVSEALAVTSINVREKEINDLTGIEAFINLTLLNCVNNNLTSLDVTNNLLLSNIQCQVNNFNSLDFTLNTQLGFLNCGASPNLSSLELPDIDSIIAVYATNGSLSALDVSMLPNLVVLALSGNNITSMDLSQNDFLTEIYLNNNNLENVNLVGANSLTRIQVENNPISELDISDNLLLNTFSFQNTQITEMDLSNYPDLLAVWAFDNNLETLNMSNGNNEDVVVFDASNNPNLPCIQVDDSVLANAGVGAYEFWIKDESASYAEDCNALSLNEVSEPITAFFPNPTENLLHISSQLKIESYSLYTLQGKLIEHKNIDDRKSEVNLEQIPTGMYLIKIRTKEGIIIHRIIKK